MNKKLLIILGACLLIVMIVSLALFIKKENASLALKKSRTQSQAGLVNQAKDFEAKGQLLSAKGIYLRLINEFSNAAEIMSWQKRLEEINIKLLFSSTLTPGSIIYEIKPGDTLTKIASEFKTTAELISKSNGLSEAKIFPGRKIKVWAQSFTILVDKSQNILVLKSNEEIIKTYIVSTGKDNSTPVGNFKITDKILNPTWFKAGAVIPAGSPENILGTRWLGFNLPGYGIHGTTQPQTLGRQVTQGCVRMSNSDVEELYIAVPIGAEVTVVD